MKNSGHFLRRIAPYFTEGFGRPTKELYMALGVIILQQAHDLTDDETICQLAFSEQWHYALDIASPSDDATYMSQKTLWNMRKIVTDNGLDSIIFNQTTDTLARVFTVDISKQRLDLSTYKIQHAQPRPYPYLCRDDS